MQPASALPTAQDETQPPEPQEPSSSEAEEEEEEEEESTPVAAAAADHSTTTPPTSNGLDDVLWTQVLTYLSLPDVVHGAQLVSRAWRGLATSKEVWELLCNARWAWMAQPSSSTSSSSSSAQTDSPRLAPTHFYDLYRRRAQVRRLVRYPKPPRPLSHFDLAVDLRSRVSSAPIFSCRGPIDESFPTALFEFAGWTLVPTVVATNDGLLFSSVSAAMAFFGEQGPCELDFTVIDKTTGKLAEFASVLRHGLHATTTRCSLGWNADGEGNEEELWVFSAPDAVFAEGELRLLRGVTLSLQRVPYEMHAAEAEGWGADECEQGDEAQQVKVVQCRVKSAWACDHQYLSATDKPTAEDVGALFHQLTWV